MVIEAVRLKLAVTQAHEKNILADIKILEQPENLVEALDRELGLCHSAIESKEQEAALER